MQNRRKTIRRYLLYFVRIYDSSTSQQIGNLVDITTKGVMIVGPSPIPENKTIQLRLELTADVADKPFMEFMANSKWCHPDLDPSMYNIGFEIKGLSQVDTKIIQKIIDMFGFRDNEPKS